MSGLILNGNSLLRNAAGLATSSQCCCEQPRCLCAGECLYVLAVTGPVSADGGLCSCRGIGPACSISQKYWPLVLDPPGLGDTFYQPESAFGSFAETIFSRQSFFWVGYSATFREQFYFRQRFPPSGSNFLVQAFGYEARFALRCLEANPIEPASQARYILDLQVKFSVLLYETYLSFTNTEGSPFFRRARVCRKEVVISPACRRDIDGTCLQEPLVFGFLPQQSYNVTVSPTTTSLGDWDSVVDTESGDLGFYGDPGRVDYESLADNARDYFRDNISVSFSLTQRETCDTDCDCGADIDGVQVKFDGKTFTLGTNATETASDDDFLYRWRHFVSGGEYVFRYEKYIEYTSGGVVFEATLEQQQAVLICEEDFESEEPEPRWYVNYTTSCLEYEPDEEDPDALGTLVAQTLRSYVGYLVCNRASGCAAIAKGVKFPFGEILELEELEESPLIPGGLNECSTSAIKSFSISEGCG